MQGFLFIFPLTRCFLYPNGYNQGEGMIKPLYWVGQSKKDLLRCCTHLPAAQGCSESCARILICKMKSKRVVGTSMPI
ncbi:MAG TPA: hypothetical protein DC012_08585 [Escherichia sp.]|nr:hypothetical protein [Escherichia sp.]